MKGILLAGGNGRRLGYLTEVTNKHLLAVYDKPMIFFPLQTLLACGIRDILIISGRDHVGGFLRLLGSGEQFGARFSYKVQDSAGGIAQALGLARDFVGTDTCAVILGDNVFEDDMSMHVTSFEKNGSGAGAHIFLKETENAARFGVAELDGNRVLNIEEKPLQPKTNYAVTGFYLYDATVFDIIEKLAPSGRGELEITDVNNAYIAAGTMTATILQGDWTDAGTFESLHHANVLARKLGQARDGLLLEDDAGSRTHGTIKGNAAKISEITYDN